MEQNGERRNRCSDLEFGGYVPGKFSSGVEGGRIAAFADLGTEETLAARYSVAETVGGGQAFASIRLDLGKLSIGRKTRQELGGTEVLFGKLQSGANAAISAGHIYVLRIGDEHDPTHNVFVKFLVVVYAPGESVTIRWKVL